MSNLPTDVLFLILRPVILDKDQKIKWNEFVNTRSLCTQFQYACDHLISSKMPYFKEPLERRKETIDMIENLYASVTRIYVNHKIKKRNFLRFYVWKLLKDIRLAVLKKDGLGVLEYNLPDDLSRYVKEINNFEYLLPFYGRYFPLKQTKVSIKRITLGCFTDCFNGKNLSVCTNWDILLSKADFSEFKYLELDDNEGTFDDSSTAEKTVQYLAEFMKGNKKQYSVQVEYCKPKLPSEYRHILLKLLFLSTTKYSDVKKLTQYLSSYHNGDFRLHVYYSSFRNIKRFFLYVYGKNWDGILSDRFISNLMTELDNLENLRFFWKFNDGHILTVWLRTRNEERE